MKNTKTARTGKTVKRFAGVFAAALMTVSAASAGITAFAADGAEFKYQVLDNGSIKITRYHNGEWDPGLKHEFIIRNAKCQLAGEAFGTGGMFTCDPTVTLCGTKGSTAEKFAHDRSVFLFEIK